MNASVPAQRYAVAINDSGFYGLGMATGLKQQRETDIRAFKIEAGCACDVPHHLYAFPPAIFGIGAAPDDPIPRNVVFGLDCMALVDSRPGFTWPGLNLEPTTSHFNRKQPAH